MCNSYRIAPKRGAVQSITDKISAAAGKLAGSLVRKSDPGIVVLAAERVEIMRWGFHRNFNPSINNARSDKFQSAIWRESFARRRCVIPMSLFYEWGPGIRGHKQAHEFHDPGDDFLWVAGIWEDTPDFGPCYSMVTTDAPPLMMPIHNRMPAILHPDELPDFLGGETPWAFSPYSGNLKISPCESPLVKPRAPDPQQELF